MVISLLKITNYLISYFYNNKILFLKVAFLLVLATVVTHTGWAQNISKPVKKVEIKEDTTHLVIDSAYLESALKDPVHSFAEDSLVYDFGDVDTIVYLFKGSKVTSMDMEIKADYLEMSRKKGTIYAAGYPDTAGVLQGKPIFKLDGEEFKMETMIYNYATKKARIVDVYTKQGDGFLYGDVSKRMPDNSTFIKGARYTTCDHEHPHFYIKMTKGKVVDKPRNIYFGPSFLVIEDVPFPLVLPFGFFPQMSNRSSGIRIPTYGEEINRGFFFRNFGYYFAIGDYMDLDLLADYYTGGSWAVRSNSRYTKRYKYNGGFNLDYATNITSDKNSFDYNKATTFSVRWNHSQSPKAKPGTTFSASVNFSSINNNRYLNNATSNPYEALKNSINSSIAYGRSWEGSPINFSANANHSQNMQDSTYSITFPNFTISVNRINPFVKADRVGKKKFYEDFAFNYIGTFDNKVNFKSTEFGQPSFMRKINNGLNHNIGINLPTATVAKHVQLVPTIRYGTKWYFKKTTQTWDPELKKIVRDTSAAFSHFGTTHEYSYGISANTQIIGLVQFKKGSLIQAVRHVMKPSISFSYNPNLVTHFNGFRYVQSDTLGNMKQYNIYEGQPFGFPTQQESGSIGFSLTNNLEMKVRNRKDTIGKGGFSKIPLLNTFNINTSYNLLADSMNLSNISFNASTTLPGQTALTFSFTIDPYAINYRGQRISQFQWSQKRGLNIGRLTNFNLSFGHSFNGGKGDGGAQTKPDDDMTGIKSNQVSNFVPDNSNQNQLQQNPVNPLFYEEFNMPWSFNFNFSYSYTKSYSFTNNTLITNIQHTPTLNFNGNISPTSKWEMGFSSGFDIKKRELTTTQINLSRNLHCFNFTFQWVPLGRFQSWSFRIGILSSMLSDILKYDKQSNFFDNR